MVILSLGSNLSSHFGDRFQTLNLALLYLESYGIKIIKKSCFYETPSYPDNKDPKFINIIILIKTNLPPIDLISVLIFIEEKLGRKRDRKNDPRTCDIDIIDYKDQIINFKYKKMDLTVPHKKLTFRNFVLFPLREVLPEWIHPKTKVSINDLINKLSDKDKKSILKVKKN